jgi:cation diffusion facilitator family transporter
MPRRHSSRKRVVYAALAGNLAITLTKFVAAAISGSSAMLSEGVHSLVDTTNELLLLYGLSRASRPPTPSHPLGFGRELYFWSFIVALLVFTLGAGVALWQGVSRVLHPRELESAWLNYTVLAGAFVFEGLSWRVAFRQFRKAKGSQGWLEAIRASKDASTLTVLLEDTAALLGVIVAAAGIAAAHVLDMPRLDGVASIGIGLLLAVSSLVLAAETKGLLIGEPAEPWLRDAILQIAQDDKAIRKANGVLTFQMGVDRIAAALSVEFEDHLTANDIEACVRRVEDRVAEKHPEVVMLFVKPQAQKVWAQRMERLRAGETKTAP